MGLFILYHLLPTPNPKYELKIKYLQLTAIVLYKFIYE